MRLIDADELIEHAWRDKLDSRELIAKMIDNAPTIKEIPTNIPIDVFEKLISQDSVIDKIRAEIETKYGQCDICEYFEDYDYEENDISEYRPIGGIADILQIIDKYKAESKPQESEE